jgi:hypothetical protein
MDEKSLARAMDDFEMERTCESVIMGGMLSVMMVVVMVQALQNVAGTQLEASAYGYPAVADNTGLVWIQMTPAGGPNQVRIISENSTGAFEEVLLGLTT